jgi:hypothetical protein
VRPLVVIIGLVAGVACGLGGAFACEDDAECDGGGEPGVCQASGYCSFPDGECPSGQRYGEHVGGELAGECVPEIDETGDDSGGETSVSSTSPDDDPTLDGDASSVDTSGAPQSDSSSGPVGVDDTGGDSETTDGPIELDPDLVLWLTFDDPEAPLADASSYARSVTCDAGTDLCPVVVADGGMDLAALFDGTDDLLQVTHDAALETDEGLTVAMRVRNDFLSDLPIHTVIARPYDVVNDNSWEVFFRDEDVDGITDLVFEIADPMLGQIQLVAPAPAVEGEWGRIVAVWTVDSVALYVDGVVQTTAPSTGMLFDASPVVVGGDIDSLIPRNWFLGAIDDVRIYRRALTVAEIAELP